MIVLRNKEFARRDYENLTGKEAEQYRAYRKSIADEIRQVRNSSATFGHGSTGSYEEIAGLKKNTLQGQRLTNASTFGSWGEFVTPEQKRGTVERLRKNASEEALNIGKGLSSEYKQNLIKNRSLGTKTKVLVRGLFKR